MKGKIMRSKQVLGAGVLAAAVVAFGVTSAEGSATDPQPPGTLTESGASVSASMVKGSSPTSLGNSKLASAVATTDEAPGDVVSFVVAKTYDPATGAVTAKHRFGQRTEGKRLHMPKVLFGHGTGGTTSASGCARVTVHQTLKSVTGLSTLAKWQIWTDWCWTRSNQVVSVNDTGVIQDHDQIWSYDGVLSEFNENHYYDFSVNDGHPRSAYMFVRAAKFSGPAITLGSPVSHWTPKNSLASYYNGTWQWWTSD